MRIGIRREDKSRWEARIPIVPDHIRALRDDGFEVHVQPSEQRVFADAELAAAGAVLDEGLDGCPLILGVKEIPLDVFVPGKTYLFFSHVIKGQPYNMPMLARMMDCGASLWDYERIVDDQGRRLVSFSRFAGLAGMIDTLWVLGRRLAAEGRPTPLADLKQALAYDSLATAKAHVAEVAAHCRRDPAFSLNLAVTGTGRVSQGALEVAEALQPRTVRPSALSSAGPGFNLAVYDIPDLVARRDGGAVDAQEYFEHPERYRGRFAESLPHLDAIVNGIYWEERYPRLVTRRDVEGLFAEGRSPRLQVIGDVSCDIEGSVEITSRPCDPGNPSYVYDPDSGESRDGVEGRGIVVMATDILPTELPREASRAFSDALMELLPALRSVESSAPSRTWPLPPPLERARILQDGALTPDYEYLRAALAAD